MPAVSQARGLARAPRKAPHGAFIGVNVGPVIIPWASLATLLWFERYTASGQRASLGPLMITGACLAITGTTLAVAAFPWA
jgi:hypothetical protein